jgi:hypothetical protein
MWFGAVFNDCAVFCASIALPAGKVAGALLGELREWFEDLRRVLVNLLA